MRSLYGPVRAGDITGSATVKFSFDAWKEGNVAHTTQSLSIQAPPPKPDAPKAEPVSERFVATLPHPEKKSAICSVNYSPDGKRLVTAGYISGVIQFWDVDTRQETFRVQSSKGHRTSTDFALMTPDWKTLHVATQEEKTTRVERDGKKADLYELTGRVRRWDMATKKEIEAFAPPAGWGNLIAGISDDGRFLFSIEHKARLRDESSVQQLAVWETANGKRAVIDMKGWRPLFVPGGRIATTAGSEAGTINVAVYSLPSGKKSVEKSHKAGTGWPTMVDASADGKLLAVNLGGKKGTTTTTLLLDADTLEETARWIGPAKPTGFGHTDGRFTLDGKRFLVVDGENNMNVFDVAAKKLVRTVKLENSGWMTAVSGDGRWFATAWMPAHDQEHKTEPDPDLLPQPRVILVDLNDPASKPVTLTAPRGTAWGLAFRPDGKQLALGGSGGVHLFDLTALGGK